MFLLLLIALPMKESTRVATEKASNKPIPIEALTDMISFKLTFSMALLIAKTHKALKMNVNTAAATIPKAGRVIFEKMFLDEDKPRSAITLVIAARIVVKRRNVRVGANGKTLDSDPFITEITISN